MITYLRFKERIDDIIKEHMQDYKNGVKLFTDLYQNDIILDKEKYLESTVKNIQSELLYLGINIEYNNLFLHIKNIKSINYNSLYKTLNLNKYTLLKENKYKTYIPNINESVSIAFREVKKFMFLFDKDINFIDFRYEYEDGDRQFYFDNVDIYINEYNNILFTIIG